MRWRAMLWGALGLAACIGPPPRPAPAPPPRPAPAPPRAVAAAGGGLAADPVRAPELFEHREWIGRELIVDIDEPLRDETQTNMARAGEYAVDVADAGPSSLVLAPGPELPHLPNLAPPIRVRGVLTRDTYGLRLAVREVTRRTFPTPTRIARAAEILGDRSRWAGRLVEVEDDYWWAFEASLLGERHIWLSYYPDAKVRCAPEAKPGERASGGPARVRVIGFARTAGGYGHQARREAMIEAIEVVFLDPARPECR